MYHLGIIIIMPNIPTLEELLQAGVHFGHKTSKWSPKMERYIFTHRGGVHILDLEKTKEALEKACAFARNLAKQGKKILFIGTKPQAREIIKKYASASGVPYVIERWIGGTLTNLPVILGMVQKLKNIMSAEESGDLKRKYTKKERLTITRDKDRLEKLIGGIKDLEELPGALFVVGLKEEKTAVREAKRKGISVIGLVDTNTDPDMVTHPIPANDDASKSIDLITGVISEAWKEGKEEFEKEKQEAAKKEEAGASQKPKRAQKIKKIGTVDVSAKEEVSGLAEKKD